MKITFIMIIVGFLFLALFVSLVVLVIRALLKYIKSKDVRMEKVGVRKSLGEAIKAHRTRCKMTQEFVAETLGVSRQAVSKWENGTSDPRTSHDLAVFDSPQSCMVTDFFTALFRVHHTPINHPL